MTWWVLNSLHSSYESHSFHFVLSWNLYPCNLYVAHDIIHCPWIFVVHQHIMMHICLLSTSKWLCLTSGSDVLTSLWCSAAKRTQLPDTNLTLMTSSVTLTMAAKSLRREFCLNLHRPITPYPCVVGRHCYACLLYAIFVLCCGQLRSAVRGRVPPIYDAGTFMGYDELGSWSLTGPVYLQWCHPVRDGLHFWDLHFPCPKSFCGVWVACVHCLFLLSHSLMLGMSPCPSTTGIAHGVQGNNSDYVNVYKLKTLPLLWVQYLYKKQQWI